jgi:hypothetical protein
MNTELTKIPGTLYSLGFGTEGNYYAVFLYRGRQAINTKKLSIVRGSSLRDLPDEVENGLRHLLDNEEIYISPAIIDRVVNDLMDKIPKEGQVFTKETTERKLVSENVNVKELINKSESRSKKQEEATEMPPKKEKKYDASAMDITPPKPRTPKPLPEKEEAVKKEQIPAPREIQRTPETAKVATQSKSNILKEEDLAPLEEQVTKLTDELNDLQELVTKNKNNITSVKRSITILKNKLKEMNE